MVRARVGLLVGVVLVVVALASCAAPANELAVHGGGAAARAPGFWWGLWHGVISPITLIISWFSDTVGVYAVRNRGGWYDFGFMLGVSIIFGGSRGPGAYRGSRRSSGRDQV